MNVRMQQSKKHLAVAIEMNVKAFQVEEVSLAFAAAKIRARVLN